MQKSKKSLVLWTTALTVVCASVVIVFMMVIATTQGQSMLKQPVSASDRIIGSPGAKVTMVVYSDFQCGSCALASSNLLQLQQDSGDRVRLVCRHFPLPAHEHSIAAAQAAEAAGKQGKYLAMQELLFEHQQEWSDSKNVQEHFERYAAQLGLVVERFRADATGKEIESKVRSDFNGALASKAEGTPTVYLNGRKVPGSFNLQRLKGLVDAALKP